MATFLRRDAPPIKTRKGYRWFREEVREDFNGYCAYCGVHEDQWPHREKLYQQDHFRPRKVFPDDEYVNGFYNLCWCCTVCNRVDAKGDKWPSPEEEALGKGFVDLCEDDWEMHYEIQPNGVLKPLTMKADYTIETIGLNGQDYVEHRLSIIQKGYSIFPVIKRRSIT